MSRPAMMRSAMGWLLLSLACIACSTSDPCPSGQRASKIEDRCIPIAREGEPEQSADATLDEAGPGLPVDASLDPSSPDGAARTDAGGCPDGAVSGCPVDHGCPAHYPCVANSCGYTCQGQYADWPLPKRTAGQTLGQQRFKYPGTSKAVLDEVTGLMWETKPTRPSMTYEEARLHCETLDLDGITGFRLPSTIEVSSLLTGPVLPALDRNIFVGPPEGALDYWTGTPSIPGYHFCLEMVGGEQGACPNGDPRTARCVRRAEERYLGTPATRFTAPSPDGTTTDTATGLTWQLGVADLPQQHSAALAHCESLVLDGRDDWRLPQAAELLTTFDVSKPEPLIDSLRGPTEGDYWSSTTSMVDGEERLFLVGLGGGTELVPRRENRAARARCVAGP